MRLLPRGDCELRLLGRLCGAGGMDGEIEDDGEVMFEGETGGGSGEPEEK